MGVSDSEEADQLESSHRSSLNEKPRNLIAYWLLGLCNNYAYVIMLSAAHDILSHDFQNETSVPPPVTNNTRDCNPVSTGAILLADVLPSLVMKLTTPFLLSHIRFRVLIVAMASSASFLLVSLSTAQWQAFLGVVCAALSGGLGEVTFLQYSARYHKNVVSTWSSGTGGSGLFGALSFAALTSAGLSPRKTVLLMLIIPAVMMITFFFVLEHEVRRPRSAIRCDDIEPLLEQSQEIVIKAPAVHLSMKEKFRIVPKMAYYIIPLCLVYLFEYFINQGLLELIYFRGIWLNHASQYRWFQVDYQLGVFLSRSSVNLFRIKAIWFLALLQFINMAVLCTEAIFLYIPSIWIVFTLVLWEGMIAGAAYVNTFYRVANEALPEEKAFAMGITSLAGSIGVSTAGALAVPFHQYLCSLPLFNY